MNTWSTFENVFFYLTIRLDMTLKLFCSSTNLDAHVVGYLLKAKARYFKASFGYISR